MDKRQWLLIHRKEDRHLVWVYEPLSEDQVKQLRREGWKVIKC